MFLPHFGIFGDLHCITKQMYDSMESICSGQESISGGGVTEWLRHWTCKCGGPRFKPFTLLLTRFVLGCPEFNSLAALCI